MCSYKKGEKVLCFHGPLIYEARCLDVRQQKNNKKKEYLIHYMGWKKRWDEWLTADERLLKYNQTNLQQQEQLKLNIRNASIKKEKDTITRRATRSINQLEKSPKLPETSNLDCPETLEIPKTGEISETPEIPERFEIPEIKNEKGPKIKKRKISVQSKSCESDTSQCETQTRKKQKILDVSEVPELTKEPSPYTLKVKIPHELQFWLVIDWEFVTKQNKIVDLPAKLTVEHILDNYVALKKSSKHHNQKKEMNLLDITTGIRDYFNETLALQLLHTYERNQFEEVSQNHPDTPFSQIYGTIHLLRLFAKIEPMLKISNLDKDSYKHVITCIEDIMKYIVKNKIIFINVEDYVINKLSNSDK